MRNKSLKVLKLKNLDQRGGGIAVQYKALYHRRQSGGDAIKLYYFGIL